jgi:nucleoside ABC transporter membrane protein
MPVLDLATDAMIAAIRVGTPLLFATLGEIYAERSGVLNLGVEGMMLTGALAGFVTTLWTGSPVLGLLAGAGAGGLMALIHAFLSISLRANQIVSGLALTMFGIGLTGVLGRRFVGIQLARRFYPISIPVLSEIPVIGPLFSSNAMVYLSLALAVLLWFILFKTRFGINIRAVGENPAAADALGVNVYLIRYLCVMIGGVLAGIGGAFLPLGKPLSWTENMTAGLGWIAVALTIFAMWRPGRAIFGSYLFGAMLWLAYRFQPYFASNILNMAPYVLTMIVLLLGTREILRKRIGAPSALCVPYHRGER